MGDLYVVDVSLDLPDSVPDAVLSDLRWHLGLTGTAGDIGIDEFPVWSARGAATRIGGVLIGELVQGPAGWSLTIRQEVHEERLSEVESLIDRLARHSNTQGVIGQIRFFEDYTPDLLINDSGTVLKAVLKYSESTMIP